MTGQGMQAVIFLTISRAKRAVAPIFQFWDRPSQALVAQFDHAVLKNDTRHPFVVQCEQFKTAKLVLDRLHSECRGTVRS
jgi:3-(3-hydroxy-phenyl)propionate hydroxylase